MSFASYLSGFSAQAASIPRLQKFFFSLILKRVSEFSPHRYLCWYYGLKTPFANPCKTVLLKVCALLLPRGISCFLGYQLSEKNLKAWIFFEITAHGLPGLIKSKIYYRAKWWLCSHLLFYRIYMSEPIQYILEEF